MMQVCTMVCGHTLATTSGSPLRPSQTRKNVSFTPRLRMSVRTLIQNFAPSPPVPTHSPRMSFASANDTPSAALDRSVRDLPVADLDHDRVDEDRSVDLLELPGLPGRHLLD